MEAMTTKEVALKLGVSPTTVKRWVAFFQGWFQKDELGHYIYSEDDLQRLRSIQEQLQQGKTMQAIWDGDSRTVKPRTLPVAELQSAGAAISHSAAQTDALLQRIADLELRLEQKASDIVSTQILQHRNELDEIRKSVQTLAAEVEVIQRSLSRHSERTLASLRETPKPSKKKGFISMLFSMF
ncbi:Chromosome-anchoring protein RacA [Paenibacillus konkukensis]|uniref:Chromosome-anchoring protein RacA n=1 Tax=Paenibacillus konkukensis TaxID=2020716 RepID=A0ABY4RKV7_9BACL|nr:MerR family transcriptional regulator [Paenibacillus konkukensis]UQZ83046.1 Chromosome-anchoring protein RacA [Paenibacillus konkukensis]